MELANCLDNMVLGWSDRWSVAQRDSVLFRSIPFYSVAIPFYSVLFQLLRVATPVDGGPGAPKCDAFWSHTLEDCFKSEHQNELINSRNYLGPQSPWFMISAALKWRTASVFCSRMRHGNHEPLTLRSAVISGIN